jgi:hypothetical protein
MMPSLTPSSVSHCLRTSLWIKPVHIAGDMKSGDDDEPVIGKKLALHDIRSLKARAGAPATMPSKSSGYFSAAPMPWRPPCEQPRKYDLEEARP